MVEVGKFLLLVGAVIIILGGVRMIKNKINLPVGRLPGDFVYRGKNSVFYFPLATSLLLSAILSLIFWLIGRGRH